eukprot:TRINITY_DN29067_c0_g1_i1.p1 TRINITY_DN29067_c0_g1~~TRINITY_DN29067_c0_g1_i1.p1  ORF type:complete len:141 (-),score=33.54 TRINITY_DN29067_c0_g1_i1:128-550(-)
MNSSGGCFAMSALSPIPEGRVMTLFPDEADRKIDQKLLAALEDQRFRNSLHERRNKRRNIFSFERDEAEDSSNNKLEFEIVTSDNVSEQVNVQRKEVEDAESLLGLPNSEEDTCFSPLKSVSVSKVQGVGGLSLKLCIED